MGDLNNHLFMALERLNDESLTGDELAREIERSKAVADVASQVISNANTRIKVVSLKMKIHKAPEALELPE